MGEWYANAHRLRHRVVHGGYTPTRAEAVHALDVVHNLERFLFDRLANQRTRYPRATLMTVAEQGLRNRDLWKGKIKNFAEHDAASEPNWSESFRGFYRELTAARMPN